MTTACSVSPCGKPAFRKGLCTTHYSRQRRHGDTTTVKPPGKPASEAVCTVQDCGRKAAARGLCSKHWQKWRAYGDPLGGKFDRSETDRQRFWRKVNKNGPVSTHAPHLGPCWEWTLATNEDGYGVFALDGRHQRTHRVAYQWEKGPIPDDLVIDHLCRNRKCCRPSHLQPVTDHVNVLRGISPWGINAAKTHCVRNHEFTPENTRLRRNGTRVSRICRECERQRNRASYQRKKLAA